jgi:GAF domain-containing protein
VRKAPEWGIIRGVGHELGREATRPEAKENRRAPRATAAARGLRSSLHAGPPTAPVDLAELVRTLQVEHSVPATLERIVQLALLAVPGCEHASVTLPGPAAPTATDGLARRLDAMQYAAGDGPSLDALDAHAPRLSVDLAAEKRWTDFAAGAVQAGVRSVLSCRLALGGKAFGALNLYAGPPGAFGPESLPVASAYAAHAAAALARAAEQEQVVQLRQAVASNRIIGTAIGLLMGTRRISEAEAFDLLRVSSQHTNRTLRDIAADTVARRGVIASP